MICSAALLLQQPAPGCCFLATDVSTAAIDATRQTLSNHGLEGVELVQTDLLTDCHQVHGEVDLLVRQKPRCIVECLCHVPVLQRNGAL